MILLLHISFYYLIFEVTPRSEREPYTWSWVMSDPLYIGEMCEVWNDSNTVLLIHSDTTNGDATFTDSSSSWETHSFTRYGWITHSTWAKYFGNSSIYFDGSDDYLTTPNSSDWDFWDWDFTVDFWVNWETVQNWGIIWKRSSKIGRL